MRILIIGAGGVGSSAALIAARRDFYEHIVIGDYEMFDGSRRYLYETTEGALARIREVSARGERVLVTTLTKKMSEELTQYLMECGVRVRSTRSPTCST